MTPQHREALKQARAAASYGVDGMVDEFVSRLEANNGDEIATLASLPEPDPGIPSVALARLLDEAVLRLAAQKRSSP